MPSLRCDHDRSDTRHTGRVAPWAAGILLVGGMACGALVWAFRDRPGARAPAAALPAPPPPPHASFPSAPTRGYDRAAAHVETRSALAAPTPADPSPEVIAAHQVDALERAFRGEAPDRRWAVEAEAHFGQVLAGEGLAGTRVVALSCHSSICRLQVAHTRQEDWDQFVSGLPKQLGWNAEGFIRVQASGPAGIETVAYFSRDGRSLPHIL